MTGSSGELILYTDLGGFVRAQVGLHVGKQRPEATCKEHLQVRREGDR